jgi:hypothetical protein
MIQLEPGNPFAIGEHRRLAEVAQFAAIEIWWNVGSEM